MALLKKVVIAAVLILSTGVIGCRKENKETLVIKEDKTSIIVGFSHTVGNNAFFKDTLQYVNAAGNKYEINDLQYFISDIILHRSDSESVTITADSGIHYIDIDIPVTLNWAVAQKIPAGDYTSVSFTFGINEAKNKTGLFVNPPERDMFWPEPMGGGYHYMKMNGKWIDTLNQLTPFNFHIGIGMMDMNFVQNYFTVQVPNSGVKLIAGVSHKLIINMDIASWFETPNLWDWDVIGGQIMQKQWAMKMACENGGDAFSCIWSTK
jgi:hypothetical protein